ncbi:MAG: DUF1501 domain-containing protein, partial [Pirellula sp.]
MIHRRHWLQQCGMGLGGLAFADLLASESRANQETTAQSRGFVEPHFPPTAKHIIHVFLNGGVSQV